MWPIFLFAYVIDVCSRTWKALESLAHDCLHGLWCFAKAESHMYSYFPSSVTKAVLRASSGLTRIVRKAVLTSVVDK